MAKGDDIEDRLIRYAVRIIKVCNSLPPTAIGKHIGGQLLRAGTAPAPNYGEGRSAESLRDFVHKLKVALKELNESRIWLKMVILSELIPEELLTNLLAECEQLCRILHASIQTAQNNDKGKLMQK